MQIFQCIYSSIKRSNERRGSNIRAVFRRGSKVSLEADFQTKYIIFLDNFEKMSLCVEWRQCGEM